MVSLSRSLHLLSHLASNSLVIQSLDHFIISVKSLKELARSHSAAGVNLGVVDISDAEVVDSIGVDKPEGFSKS